MNRAPLFLCLSESRKNLEEHCASLVNSSLVFYEEARMTVPPPQNDEHLGGYIYPHIRYTKKVVVTDK